MSQQAVAIRFSNVSYRYSREKVTLDDASFSIREGAKITIMGQNGAGKTTLFKLITGQLKPDSGVIHIRPRATIAVALQVVPREKLDLTVHEFFESAFDEIVYDIDRRIEEVMEVVRLNVLLNKTVRQLSGGQQARLLLAYALIQEPDILLLDEPTNNLDAEGINHLTGFLLGYEKTVIVISHDAEFLNTFTDGVLHLDVFTHKVEQYVGNYFDVVEEIQAQIEREQRKNAQLKKNIQDRKDKVNFFSHKGGKMRRLASKMREEIEESEAEMVDVRREDKTIRPFRIPSQDIGNPIAHIRSVHIMEDHVVKQKKADITLRKKDIIHIVGPNGIGKTTLLEKLAHGEEEGLEIIEGVRVGYYRQDFSGLDFESTPFQALKDVQIKGNSQDIYQAAAHFLLTSEMLEHTIGSLSEGQKGLLCYARFMLEQPTLLILDEPTNHINFRHLPVIAEALNAFTGAVLLVCHDEEFVKKLNVTQTVDLTELRS